MRMEIIMITFGKFSAGSETLLLVLISCYNFASYLRWSVEWKWQRIFFAAISDGKRDDDELENCTDKEEFYLLPHAMSREKIGIFRFVVYSVLDGVEQKRALLS